MAKNYGGEHDVGNIFAQYTPRLMRLAAVNVCGLDADKAHHMDGEHLAAYINAHEHRAEAIAVMDAELKLLRGEDDKCAPSALL